MQSLKDIAFLVDDDKGISRITPIVDGVSLIELVSTFENNNHYDCAGTYGPIIPSFFKFGDLNLYYIGQETKQWPGAGKLWLLGCDCGEVGCWPLEATVKVGEQTITWSDFRQPYREKRSYDGFGPFVFDRENYQRAVREAVMQLSAE
jgi:hypothetical protein